MRAENTIIRAKGFIRKSSFKEIEERKMAGSES